MGLDLEVSNPNPTLEELLNTTEFCLLLFFLLNFSPKCVCVCVIIYIIILYYIYFPVPGMKPRAARCGFCLFFQMQLSGKRNLNYLFFIFLKTFIYVCECSICMCDCVAEEGIGLTVVSHYVVAGN